MMELEHWDMNWVGLLLHGGELRLVISVIEREEKLNFLLIIAEKRCGAQSVRRNYSVKHELNFLMSRVPLFAWGL